MSLASPTDIEQVKRVLANGAQRARAVAAKTLAQVRNAVGLELNR